MLDSNSRGGPKVHVTMHRFLLLNVFVAALTDGLSQADAEMHDFDDDEEETAMEREHNFLAPGHYRAHILCLCVATRPLSSWCSQIWRP
jgi:hypothetical protein